MYNKCRLISERRSESNRSEHLIINVMQRRVKKLLPSFASLFSGQLVNSGLSRDKLELQALNA